MPDEKVDLLADPDEPLLRAALSAPDGDTRAFEELVRRHHRRILADCRYLTRNPSDSEDLAQEVFVKAYFALRRFESRATFGHWLRRIKVNHCLNHRRREDSRRPVAIEDEELQDVEQLRVAPLAAGQLENADLRERINLILAAMPETLRLPLVLRDMDDLSYEEVAAALGIGLSAVKMRIKRAREEFRRLYEQEGGVA
jgi:RNA polymerase sigma-70 factor (ECF subfamily)